MSAARTEPLQVRCPILRGDRLGWIDGDNKLIEGANAVETTALHVIVYIERTMHEFSLRDDGHYWATWAPSDSTRQGQLVLISRTRGEA